MEDEQFPIVDPELVKKLEELYPDVCPDPTDLNAAELGTIYGEVRVIRFLRSKMEEQQENILTSRG